MTYPRSLEGTNVIPRWCITASGPNQDEAPYTLSVQTYWGLLRFDILEFDNFNDAVAFLDNEIIGLTRLDNAS